MGIKYNFDKGKTVYFRLINSRKQWYFLLKMIIIRKRLREYLRINECSLYLVTFFDCMSQFFASVFLFCFFFVCLFFILFYFFVLIYWVSLKSLPVLSSPAGYSSVDPDSRLSWVCDTGSGFSSTQSNYSPRRLSHLPPSHLFRGSRSDAGAALWLLNAARVL